MSVAALPQRYRTLGEHARRTCSFIRGLKVDRKSDLLIHGPGLCRSAQYPRMSLKQELLHVGQSTSPEY